MKYNLLDIGNFCAPKHWMLFQFCNVAVLTIIHKRN
jgi:hypothetical protein